MTIRRVPVKQVMVDKFELVDGLITVEAALQLIGDKGLEALIIDKRDEHDEFGMVLLSDIAKQVIAKDKSPARVNLYEIMAKPVVSVSSGMDVRYCARLFDSFGIHRAPVIDEGRVLGVVSYNNIVIKGFALNGS
ncbi:MULTISPECIES: CBS domain-containing protein [Corallincola]|uniref:CBS domain-containing protein n=3 Tax=Corallincola TaxID=1775176 RepID=A0A368NSP3_9GAMM|nr:MULTISPECIES: CBS domain-containing protein [Corallincola]RCU52845.1 CBS domain-containing protein [Corallincola holothuriorum]TAA48002.1 CBS domain-containing protein [Corallincola spongiicola]TCI03344.1 CBS domain-containing protein [Corallincola luteus]